MKCSRFLIERLCTVAGRKIWEIENMGKIIMETSWKDDVEVMESVRWREKNR